jgi:hypothetical protein
MKITIDLAGEDERQILEAARRFAVRIEDLAAAAVRDLLARPEREFDRVAAKVLARNRQLHRRLE